MGADTAAAGAAAARLDSPASVPPPPAPAAPPAPPAADPGVVSLGMGIINKIIKMLGKDSYVFAAPVDVRYVPDYYDIIKTPICLNEIRERLQQGVHFTVASMYEVRTSAAAGSLKSVQAGERSWAYEPCACQGSVYSEGCSLPGVGSSIKPGMRRSCKVYYVLCL